MVAVEIAKTQPILASLAFIVFILARVKQDFACGRRHNVLRSTKVTTYMLVTILPETLCEIR